jgi:hypothetical protein
MSRSVAPKTDFLPTVLPAALAGLLLLLPARAGAWVYPEHRHITVVGVLQLQPERRQELHALWALARKGHEARLTEAVVDSSGREPVAALDYAAWPAIAGDHSCSPEEMLRTILDTEWILEVATVAGELERDLAAAGLERYRRTNALRDSDLRLQGADPAYVSRAGSNNVHFLLARPYAETDEKSYVETCLGAGCEPNALGAWAWFHLRAMEKAARLAREGLSPSDWSTLARAALADEAYALHFLQDVFAAGHVAGTRGSAAERKGTHDYYNERGLETRLWSGKTLVLKGDAWMRPVDAERAGSAVRASLEQLLEAAAGNSPVTANEGSSTPDTLNTCSFDGMPGGDIPRGASARLASIIHLTPVPGLAEGEGELPRFRAEIGPFIGVVPAVRGAMLFGGFSPSQGATGATGGLELNARLGLGLEGVMNESGDGLVFLDFGLRLDGPASTALAEEEGIQEFGSIFSSIPSRGGVSTRLRMPFWLLPFDLLFTAPFLLPAAPETFAAMAVQAGNGGFLPWQAGMATSFGRFQFVLGREIGAAFYGYVGRGDRLLFITGPPGAEEAVLATLRSVYLEFPVVEYMPFRTFSADEGSALVVQLYGGVDIPTRVTDAFPAGAPEPRAESIWQLGMRVAFRWRHYF